VRIIRSLPYSSKALIPKSNSYADKLAVLKCKVPFVLQGANKQPPKGLLVPDTGLVNQEALLALEDAVPSDLPWENYTETFAATPLASPAPECQGMYRY
jgi:hypothetical protein